MGGAVGGGTPAFAGMTDQVAIAVRAVHARDIPGPVIRRIIQQAGISEQAWGNL